jgi:hypothetical protein
MSETKKAARSRLDTQAGNLFLEMDYAQQVGNYILSGRAQERLKRLGWIILRLPPDEQEGSEPEAPPTPAEAATDDLADEDVEADDEWGTAPADRPLAIEEVVRLVGVTADELDEAIEAGRFPLPDGHISARPYWERETIGWWVKRGKTL